jgi:hypothetical protein
VNQWEEQSQRTKGSKKEERKKLIKQEREEKQNSVDNARSLSVT